MCSPGWGNLVAFDCNDLPVGREFDGKFFSKKLNPHPMPSLLPPPPPPPPPPAGLTLIGALPCRASRKSGPVEAVKRSIFTLAVLPKYLTDESKIYIFITKVPRVVHRIFWGFFEIFIFPTPGRYLQTAAL